MEIHAWYCDAPHARRREKCRIRLNTQPIIKTQNNTFAITATVVEENPNNATMIAASPKAIAQPTIQPPDYWTPNYRMLRHFDLTSGEEKANI
jgi:hypothetical protein